MPLRRMPITRKLAALSLGASLFALLIACSGFAVYERMRFRESMISELSALAETMGTSTSASIAFHDPRTAEEMLSSLGGDHRILAAALYDDSAHVFATFKRPKVLPDTEFPRWRAEGVVFTRKTLTLSRKVLLNGEAVGTIVIVSDASELSEQLLQYAKIALLVLILSVIPTYFISSRLLQLITSPILQLSEVATLISSNEDYSIRVPQAGNDEIGRLMLAFNRMLDKIRQRDLDLTAANDKLEERVRLRTAELEQEVCERKEAENELRKAKDTAEFLAYYDALTELPNRVLLRDRIAKALAGARRRGESVGLIFLDLDHFKMINDSLGHSAGDLLLKEASARLRHLCREQDTVARLGGDEFLFVINAVRNPEQAATFARRIIDSMSEPFIVQGQLLHVTCSVGIALFPHDGADAEVLIKHADTAMYCAKANGRNSFQFFRDELTQHIRERLRIENALRLAIENRELFLHYQPQVCLESGRVMGAEALLRWHNPELGFVVPDKFISVAESSGIIVPLGEWVLRAACSDLRAWRQAGFRPLTLAINVSPVQLRYKEFGQTVSSILTEFEIVPRYLELEVTESQMISDADRTLSVLRDLADMGLKIAVDDFGTGYSNLAQLRRFPLHKLKIDRSFVRDIARDSDAAAIAATIINMAKTLGLEVTAEGVESEEQMSFLSRQGCELAQGFYFGTPVPADEFTRYLVRENRGEPADPDTQALLAETPTLGASNLQQSNLHT